MSQALLNKHSYHFRLEEDREDYLCPFESDIHYEDEDDIERLAEELADKYWSDHDGWEDQWPVTFHIYDKDENLLGSAKVQMEATPSFYVVEQNTGVEVQS